MSDSNVPGDDTAPQQPTTPAPAAPAAPVPPAAPAAPQAPAYVQNPAAPAAPQAPAYAQDPAAPPVPPVPPQQGGFPTPPPQGDFPPAPPSQPKGLAITALVLGLVALVGGLIFSWLPFVGGAITILVGIAAVILGIMALKKAQSKGMSLTGLITGGVAIVLGIGAIIAWSVVFSSASTAIDEFESTITEELDSPTFEDETDDITGSPSDSEDDSTTASGERSAEFCSALTAISSTEVDVDSTEIPESLMSAYRDMADISSPNQGVYQQFLSYIEDPLGSDSSDTMMSDYFDAVFEDSMACM